MGTIDSNVVLLSCSDPGQPRRLPGNGSRRRADLAALPAVTLPARPDRTAVDPVLAEYEPRRLLVAGTDADLAAVLVRLLRTERLDVEVAYLPVRRSPVTRVWRLPAGAAAADLALDGAVAPAPLIRDDSGGVLAGRAEIADLHGEVFCDETLVLRGDARRLVVVAGPGGLAVRAGWSGRAPDGGVRPVPPLAPSGRGSAAGRAVQVGCEPATVVADGVAHPRPLPRRTWYRHTTDWLLVRP